VVRDAKERAGDGVGSSLPTLLVIKASKTVLVVNDRDRLTLRAPNSSSTPGTARALYALALRRFIKQSTLRCKRFLLPSI
jgi:hypothetical protein